MIISMLHILHNECCWVLGWIVEYILCREVRQLSHIQLNQLLGGLEEDLPKFCKLHMSSMELTRARVVYNELENETEGSTRWGSCRHPIDLLNRKVNNDTYIYCHIRFYGLS